MRSWQKEAAIGAMRGQVMADAQENAAKAWAERRPKTLSDFRRPFTPDNTRYQGAESALASQKTFRRKAAKLPDCSRSWNID
jgi:hypothetical protein